MFASNQDSKGVRKDTVRNAEQSGESVWNMATWDLREAVDISAQELPPEIDEFGLAGFKKAASRFVKAMHVKPSPIQFECKYRLQRERHGPHAQERGGSSGCHREGIWPYGRLTVARGV